jgi:predicted nucleic acid-binding protein
VIVVDTNIIIYLLANTDLNAEAEKLWNRDRHWVAPILWRSEFRNVLMGYIRRNSLSLAEAIELSELAERKVKSRHVDGSRVIELAAASGCTAYDCEFVSLAERLGVHFVTSDRKLLEAFPQIALSMQVFAS